MGVRGLTTLVENPSRKILRKFSLHDTEVIVIDGYGLLWHLLLRTCDKADPKSHGGEYELLRSEITSFFKDLQECRITPYVVFDGSCDLDDMKRATRLERFQERIKKAEEIISGGRGTIMPPIAGQLMEQVMRELGVSFAFSQFEADRDIAILANYWKCPVLAKDSDFYIMDIAAGYISFKSLRWQDVHDEDGQRRRVFIGGIFHVQSLCRHFKVKKELLPLFASLANNDYVDSPLIENFLYSRVYSKHSTNNKPPRELRLEELLKWLSKQDTPAKAKKEVLNFFSDEAERNNVDRLVSASVEMYEVRGQSSLLIDYFERVVIDFKKSPICSVVGAPEWVAKGQQDGTIQSTCINILSKRYCISEFQVENPKEKCAWMTSKFLFSVMTGIVLSGQPIPEGKENNDCIVYIRKGNRVEEQKIHPRLEVEGFGNMPSMCEVPSLSQEIRQRLILKVLTPDLQVSSQVEEFPEEFRFALLVTLHCVHHSKVSVNELHIASLLAGWAYLDEKRLRNEPSFQIVEIEAQKDKTRGQRPDPEISHGFAQWQICLLQALRLNDLLQRPLQPCPDFSVLFNGVLMHTLYTLIQNASDKKNTKHRVMSFLNEAPGAYKFFKSMYKFIASNTKTVQGRI